MKQNMLPTLSAGFNHCGACREISTLNSLQEKFSHGLKNRWRFLSMLITGMLLTGMLIVSGCKGEKEPRSLPNIVMVVTDDMGQELGCYGDEIARTPYIDAFAGKSHLFRNAYVTAASCSPSRGSILTGLYPHQNGQVGLSHRGFSMYREFMSIPAYLKDKGYYTAIIGKLHVKPQGPFPFDYMCGGFDTPYKGQHFVFTKESREVITLDWQHEKKSEKFTRMVEDVADSTEAIIRHAGEKPFFMMINILDPHSPFYHQVDGYPEDPLKPEEVRLPDFVTMQPSAGLLNKTAGYYNGCTRADAAFGRILNILRSTGHYDNSLIIFMGDHGAPLQRGKLTNFESGLKIPFLLKFPGQDRAEVRHEYLSTVDIFPTILDLLPGEGPGGKVPGGLPGTSIRHIISGKGEHPERAFAEYNYHVGFAPEPRRSVSTPRYKLIHHLFATFYNQALEGYEREDFKADSNAIYRYHDLETYELYDLQQDPLERNNLAGEPGYEAVLDSMKGILRSWQKETNDSLWLSAEARDRFTIETTQLIQSCLKDR